MPAFMNRKAITTLLAELGERLAAEGLHADLYVVGGGAMALVYDREIVTRDIDAIFKPASEVERIAQQMVSERDDLPSDWLNSKVQAVLPLAFDEHQVQAISMPGISVNVASPEHLVAMKARAAREGRDMIDLLTLCRYLKITDIREIWRISEEVWGADYIHDDRKEQITLFLGQYGIS